MSRNTVSAIMMSLLVLGTLALVFNIQPVRASGTIYVRADGSIDPPTAPISTVDNITYTFTGDIINDSIVVERDNIVLDGAGFTVQGDGTGYGIDLSNRNNITNKSTNIKNYWYGIMLYPSSGNSISGNNITANGYGIYLDSSSNCNSISGNNITNNNEGIGLWSSSGNSISGNNITTNNYDGILLSSSSNNSISGNTIIANRGYGIELASSSGNSIFHNNFVNNSAQVFFYTSDCADVWDDGYPSGGNYWSDYAGTDLYSGPYQNITGNDGIGDTPYIIIDANNTDQYPLITPYIGVHDIAVTNVTPSKTVVGQGYSLNINVTVANQGDYTEPFNVTLYVNTTIIDTFTNVTLTSGNSTTITFTWDTTGFALGDYIISANASQVPGETEIDDNTYVDGVVKVKPPIHDIAVTDVSPDSNVVPQGLSLDIKVTVENMGTFVETFNLTVYANTTELQTKTIYDLPPETSWTLAFTWDTNSFALGDYRIKANASILPDETNTLNNDFVDGVVTIRGHGTCVYVHPEVTVVEPGETFSVDVNIYNVTDLYVWQIVLNYNSTILTPTGIYAPFSAYRPDYVMAAGGFGPPFAPPGTFNGSCTLCTITFQAKTEGISYLNFSLLWTPIGYWDILRRAVTFDTFLWDYTLSDIPFYVINGEVRVVSHDIAVTNVTPSKTVVGQDYSMRINVTVANQGDYTETFNVTAYANTTLIASETITLTSGSNETLAYAWNTTGFAYGNYTISAYAWPVPGETDTADNNFTGEWVMVSLVGDITGPDGWPEGKCDMRDIGLVARHFGETVPPAPANCDLTGPIAGVPDGIIDMRDIGLVARHFGDHYP